MTINTFLENLCREIMFLFKDFQFKEESGELTNLNVFSQSLPIPSGEDDPEPFPYIVVRAADGGKISPNSSETVRVGFVIGIFDESLNNQGYKDVFNIIDRIRQRFEKNPILCKRYCRLHSEQYPIHWTTSDEDTHPYFFGGVEMTFAIPTIEQEDTYA